ncbi:hypothetical protein HMPREF1129_1222 [Actinomyces naeslundii str. Howell 279]|uniref:Uncharacterized protein n=1 Tax=Actinomyces naeslundii (strain ATCC 12104 / DSM 43013 / CCUG 2238 / JCM 8349 / NCTC 10301 / Howell 279) TaxID=1115803 RepID=J3JK46_ACTNH|nr:hypothetical protein HMPREF1129_1222 [Actinomyces naeslundii str. Howell 279]
MWGARCAMAGGCARTGGRSVAQAGDPGVVFVPLPGGDPPGASRDGHTLSCRGAAVPPRGEPPVRDGRSALLALLAEPVAQAVVGADPGQGLGRSPRGAGGSGRRRDAPARASPHRRRR